ncbi:tRNA pseudouridine(55) synthase TruB [Paenibacillus yanchengensis]|uniref:tRNA pseudouridine synthase B n=1 Tax=Paenibacillus yanchengensis TaxID=2035833 RepID=A0ABW4YM20_9BACL
MEGILAVWKPAGWTSHDVVAKVRRLLGVKRIGHTGTLDPIVTGVLPLCIGRATRVVEYMQERPKAYTATLRLGIATDTEDITGNIIEQVDDFQVNIDDITAVLETFVGEVEQTPPMYSAVKVNGKRLYELAREGKTVERKTRQVTIYNIKLLEEHLADREATFTFEVECSKGTYIRTLCVDIGKKLGIPATMTQLVRTQSAGITANDCLTLEQIEQFMQSDELQNHLIATDEAIDHLDQICIADDQTSRILQGQRVKWQMLGITVPEDWAEGHIIKIYNASSQFLGIFTVNRENEVFQPVKIFS